MKTAGAIRPFSLIRCNPDDGETYGRFPKPHVEPCGEQTVTGASP